MNSVITTSLKNYNSDIVLAKKISQTHNLPFIKRENLSVPSFINQYQCDYFFIVKNHKLSMINKDGEEFFFHPGTGLIRTKNIDKKKDDLMIKALGVTESDHVLDCTMGLANDAIVMAYFLKNGQVTALEKNELIFLISSYGMTFYDQGSTSLKEAFSRIRAIHTDYQGYLKKCLDEEICYDSIYFDPMFNDPLYESAGITHLRSYASYDQVTEEVLTMARTIAKKRVVVKIRNTDSVFVSTHRPDIVFGGSKSKIKYAAFLA